MCGGALVGELVGELLGVDQLDYGPEWTADRTTCLLVDLRLSLLEIVRSQDLVSLPMGNCIAVVLVDIGVEESIDVQQHVAVLREGRRLFLPFGDREVGADVRLGLDLRGGGRLEARQLVAGGGGGAAAKLFGEALNPG